MTRSSKDTFSIVFRERFISLVEDGYDLIVNSKTDTLWYIKLRHMTNGNIVILKGNPKTHCIEQYTNGRIKFIGTYD